MDLPEGIAEEIRKKFHETADMQTDMLLQSLQTIYAQMPDGLEQPRQDEIVGWVLKSSLASLEASSKAQLDAVTSFMKTHKPEDILNAGK